MRDGIIAPLWKPNASTSSPHCSPTSKRGPRSCGGIFDFEAKRQRLEEVARQLEDPAVWNDQKRAQELGREKKSLDTIVGGLESISTGLADSRELFDLSREEDDDATLVSIASDVKSDRKSVV